MGNSRTKLTARDGFKTRPAQDVPIGVMINLAGWHGLITESEPWSDWVWCFEVAGHHPDGDPFKTQILLPLGTKIHYKEMN